MHEIISDGSSTVILEREVQELLRAEAAGAAPTLPALPIQYKDFAAWQNQMLSADDASRQYWHGHLDADMPRLSLPFDFPITAHTPSDGARYECALTGPAYTALTALCRQHQVTVFMLLHASLNVLLTRLTGQRDIVIATPVIGRDAAEVEPLIGFFLNTLLLRTAVEPEASFEQVLAQCKEATLNALQHQHYPFEQLIEELDLQRPVNQFPVTPVLFNVLNFLEREPLREGLQARHVPLELDAKVELELTAQEHVDGLFLHCQYRTGLFKPQTIEYLMQQWLALMQQAASAPAQRVADFAVFADVQALQAPYLQFASELPSIPVLPTVLDAPMEGVPMPMRCGAVATWRVTPKFAAWFALVLSPMPNRLVKLTPVSPRSAESPVTLSW